MQNLFDMASYPDREPSDLVIGDYWAWTRSDISATYPTDSYTLTYIFVLLASKEDVQTLVAEKQNDAHVIQAANATTSAFTAGDYQYNVVIVRDQDAAAITLEQGIITVTASSGDIRSHARKVLDAIRATLEGTATKEQQSYSIAGRSLSRRSIQELTDLEQLYFRRVTAEEQALLRKQGRAKRNSVLATMSGC